MSEFKMELIRTIRDSKNPARTMEIAVDIMRRLIAGEDEQSIAASYGIKLEEVISA